MPLNLCLAPGGIVSTWDKMDTVPLNAHIYMQIFFEYLDEDARKKLCDYEYGWADHSATIRPVPRMTIWMRIANQPVGVTVIPREPGRTFVSVRDVVTTVYDTVAGAVPGTLTTRQWGGLTEHTGGGSTYFFLNLV